MTSLNARVNMIKQQLRTGDVLNDSILNLFEEFPRHEFVPERMKEFAYSDMQIPLAHGQRMFTPLEEGTLLQALNLQGKETVLEVGTGSGYLTTLLSKMAHRVISLDFYEEFTKNAGKKLADYDRHNVELITADGSRGWLEKAPYDVIILTAAIDHVTETLRLQTLPGGKFIAVIGKDPLMQCVMYSLDHANNWQESLLFETCVPAMIDRLKPTEFVF